MKYSILSDKFFITLMGCVREEIAKYASDGNFSSHFFDDDLRGHCAITSYMLVSVARRYGYNLTIVEGVAFDEYENDERVNHCWVQYKGKIIDLTATQFGIDEQIYIVDISDDDYHAIRKNKSVIESLKNKWPDHQTPYDKNNKPKLNAARKNIINSLKVFA